MIAIVLLALGFMPIAAAEPWLICGDTANNYTANSRYHANLELLATALTYNASTSDFLFAAGSVGAGTDMVYGLALCRGDSNATACRTCVAAAFWDARQRCGYMKDAIIFYDTCLLRFSNGDFVDFVDYEFMGPPGLGVINTMNATDVTKAEPMLPGWDPGNTASVARITKIVMLLLQETSSEALQREIIMFSSNPSSGNKITFYATGRMDVSSGFPQLYSMAQCTPDLDFKECQACFQYIGVTAKENFAGKQGGRVLCPRCNLRYDTTLFYRGEPMKLITAPSAVVPPVKPAAPPMPAVVPQAPLAVPSVKQKERMSKNLVIALVVPLLASCFFLIITFRFVRRHKKGKGSQDKAKMILKEDEELVWGLDGRSQEFTIYDFSQVLEATSNFSEENKLGQGGFGPVYKGRFPDGLEIAVKRLASESGQGFIEFKNEVLLIAKLQHTNLVRLLGCCSQGREKILIYEYLPNKSLDFFIFDETRRALLVWNRRQAIIEGIAQGILYLHKHSRLRVIHRDLKASNILLDSEMNPKISDFGLAKIFSTNNIEGNTERIVGTYGYMAPEYVSEGLFSIKSDIFSFGVLILEIVSGQKTSRFHRCGDSINLLGHAWQLWKNGLWLKLVDTSLVAEGHTLEMMRCINIALLCVQENAADRPTMSHVVTMLSSQSMTLPEPKHPAYFNIRVVHEDEPTDVAEPSSLNNVTMSALHGR